MNYNMLWEKSQSLRMRGNLCMTLRRSQVWKASVKSHVESIREIFREIVASMHRSYSELLDEPYVTMRDWF